MPKQKTRKSIAKRFKITKNKVVLHQHSGAQHLRGKEDTSTHRRKNRAVRVSKSYQKKVKTLLGL